jgi:hypothetical protein
MSRQTVSRSSPSLNSEEQGDQNGAVHVNILLNFFDELRRRIPTGR